MLSWLFVGTLVALCGVLGVLQYRWIAEVSVAARERLRAGLQANLYRLSQDFNSEISNACSVLLPGSSATSAAAMEEDVAARYEQWSRTSRHAPLFREIAIAEPREDFTLQLRRLDPGTGVFATIPWPAEWAGPKRTVEWNLAGRRAGRGPTGPAPENGDPPDDGLVFEIPVFAPAAQDNGLPIVRREIGWLIFAVNPEYLRDVLLPEEVQRYLGAAGNLDYQVEVVSKAGSRRMIYESEPGDNLDLSGAADASVSLYQPQVDLLFRRPSLGGRMEGKHGHGRIMISDRGAPAALDHGVLDRGLGRGPGPDAGKWEMYVRHRAGSLEAVVWRTRLRNMAVTSGVLLLMVATVAALIRYTRRAQKLAELQMEFVAGVSHELRTPLTVIHTAAYNLQGKMAGNSSQVERYGALIQRESGRLRALVEQVLQFASLNEGRVIHQREPLSVEAVIQEAVEANRRLIEEARCAVEENVAPGTPPVLGDQAALRGALGNLVSNAAKYGSDGGWIGISAAQVADQNSVEIRVADRGRGIPRDEQGQIFDPFFRGSRAVQDQVHGTGLGLNLVKKIIEAHGGSIRVESSPGKGTAFIMRLPAAPAGAVQ